jgi:hypothetical protein
MKKYLKVIISLTIGGVAVFGIMSCSSEENSCPEERSCPVVEECQICDTDQEDNDIKECQSKIEEMEIKYADCPKIIHIKDPSCVCTDEK